MCRKGCKQKVGLINKVQSWGFNAELNSNSWIRIARWNLKELGNSGILKKLHPLFFPLHRNTKRNCLANLGWGTHGLGHHSHTTFPHEIMMPKECYKILACLLSGALSQKEQLFVINPGKHSLWRYDMKHCCWESLFVSLLLKARNDILVTQIIYQRNKWKHLSTLIRKTSWVKHLHTDQMWKL